MKIRRAAIASCTLVLALGVASADADTPRDIFIVKSTSKTPEAMVAAIKSYAERMKWQYLGDSTIKQGEVRLVKICMPEVAKQLWSVGLEISALLPCGNVGVYGKGTATEVSVLHPRYMHVLFPHPATERASAVAQPLLTQMLDEVIK